MERWVTKLVALIIIFVVSEVAILLPLKVSVLFTQMGKRGEKIISYLMCFGGGVFLGLYMLHMSPEVKVILEQSLLKPNNIDYPLTEFIIAMGMFMMLISEKLVLKLQKKRKQKQMKFEIYVQASRLSNHDNNASDPMIHHETAFAEEAETGREPDCVVNKKTTPVEITNNSNKRPEQEPDFGHGHSHGNDLSGSRSLLLLLALSLHHVFEGISIGLKHTNQAVWTLTLAILSHEIVIAFCLGMQLVSAYKNTKKVIIAGTLCSTMLPIGLAIGMLIMETGSGEQNTTMDITNGVLQALSTGVFVYVTFFEILGGEINHHDTNMTKIVYIMLGFFVLAALGLIPEGTDEIEAEFNRTLTTSPTVQGV